MTGNKTAVGLVIRQRHILVNKYENLHIPVHLGNGSGGSRVQTAALYHKSGVGSVRDRRDYAFTVGAYVFQIVYAPVHFSHKPCGQLVPECYSDICKCFHTYLRDISYFFTTRAIILFREGSSRIIPSF